MAAGDARTVLAFDYGLRRIGVAAGNTLTRTAQPVATLPAKDGEPDWNAIGRCVREWSPQVAVVGVPCNMDGSDEHKELFRQAHNFYRNGLPIDRHAIGSNPKLGPLVRDIVATAKSLDGVFPQVAAGLMKHDEPVSLDAAEFPEMTSKDLQRVLGLTIRADNTNKVVCILTMLSAYSEDSQLNVSFNAPSASGKSYIPTEIAALFPQEDLMQLAYCSPTSFFHDQSYFDQTRKVSVVDLERRILIFLDQPHVELLARLRPLLSHDRKELLLKITDRTQKSGQRTKNIVIRGYCATVFVRPR